MRTCAYTSAQIKRDNRWWIAAIVALALAVLFVYAAVRGPSGERIVVNKSSSSGVMKKVNDDGSLAPFDPLTNSLPVEQDWVK